MLGADDDGQMIFLHKKLTSFVQFNHKRHCCNVRLNIMMKR